MAHINWLGSLETMRGRSATRKTRRIRKAAPGRKLFLEPLEDRTVLSPYIVTTTADSGPGSLRDAITQTSADTSHTLYASLSNPNVDEIDFAIPASDLHHYYYKDNGGPGVSLADTIGNSLIGTTTVDDSSLTPAQVQAAIPGIDPDYLHTWYSIQPWTALPAISNSVVVNGYSQPGASPNTLAGVGVLGVAPSGSQGDNAVLTIEVDGEHVTTNDDGIVSPGKVDGLVINRFQNGAAIAGGQGPVQGDFIGTDVSGTLALGNLQGVRWTDIVGGSTPDARNLISGNTDGIIPSVSLIQGNFIGTDITGTKPIGNTVGIDVTYDDGNTIAGNLISANTSFGIVDLTNMNQIQGNFIGTDVTGTSVANLGNSQGIYLDRSHGGSGNLIGGTAAGLGNLISGNNGGVDIRSVGNFVEGNFIGTSVTGHSALGNGTGILFQDNASADLIPTDLQAAQNSTTLTSATGGFTPGMVNKLIQIVSGANFIPGSYQIMAVTNSNTVTLDRAPATAGNGSGGIGYENGNVVGLPNSQNLSDPRAWGGNVISGNASAIFLNGESGIVVQGNLVGTDPNGVASAQPGVSYGNPGQQVIGLGNGGGVAIHGSNNTLGGFAFGAANCIAYSDYGTLVTGSGNRVINNSLFDNKQGVYLVNTTNTTATGNAIWAPDRTDSVGLTDSNGNGDLIQFNTVKSVTNDGIDLINSSNVNVAGNAISSVGINGIALQGGGIDIVSSNTIEHNLRSGVFIGWFGASSNNLVTNNTIAFNSDRGVDVALTSTGNTISTNSIFANGNSGILLEPSANDNQAAPLLTGFAGSAAPTISGSLTSLVRTTFRLEFFANPTPSSLANTEGQTLLGSIYVTTDATGKASFNATGLAAIPLSENYLTATATVATATSSGYTYGDSSQFSPYLHVAYFFGGFQAPLNQGMNFALNRVIPIKFTLADLTGAAVTSLAAVNSIQVAPVNSDGSLGTPFTPASPGNTAFSVNGGTYAFNWQTKGLATGSYAIVLTLADGQVLTRVIQLTKGGNSSGLTTVAAGGTGSAPGGLLGGDITLFVDNTNGDLTADELARIQDAVTAVDGVTAPYGVAVSEVTDPTLADVTLNMDTTSAVGGYADGVLGCTTDAGQITLIQGWDYYAGSDGAQIGSGQYDFETVVTHELGHALGLGHSAGSTSVMYATLDTGIVNRTLTTADLNVPDTGTTGACGLHAAVGVGRVSDPSLDAARDMLFAFVAAQPESLPLGSRQLPGRSGEPSRTGGMAEWPANSQVAVLVSANSSSIFAAPTSSGDDYVLFDVPLFPDPDGSLLDD